MVASVDSVESGPSEGTLDPAEIDFGGPVDFEVIFGVPEGTPNGTEKESQNGSPKGPKPDP